jgi:UPF0755 protein
MRRKKLKSGGLAPLLILLILALAGAWFVYDQLRTPGGEAAISVVTHPGENLRRLGQVLFERGIIRQPLVFDLLARLTGAGKTLSPGRYQFAPGGSEYRALQVLRTSGDRMARVTIPEGFTLRQIAARLLHEEVCDSASFLAACRDTALLRRLGIPGPLAEGYLFPDSYFFPYDSRPEPVIEMMHRRFVDIARSLTPDPEGLTRECVILASLVEAEAAQDSERPIIASVFLNRLKRRMYLQSCATVEYVLPERKAVLSEADTRVESPYNTYLHPGLPPGPICNPGKASLNAALHPAQTGYLFFVSSGGGCHLFSKSLAEHAAASRRARESAASAHRQ